MKVLPVKSVPFTARRSIAAAAKGDRIYYFAGVGGNTGTESILDVSKELWRFDTETGAWCRIPEREPWPEARRCCGWAVEGGLIYLWGGSGVRRDPSDSWTYNFLNDLWAFNPEDHAWTCVEKSAEPNSDLPEPSLRPCPRYTPAFQSVQNRILLFGGYTEDALGKRKMNDLWILDPRTGWSEVRREGTVEGYDARASWPGVRYGCMSTQGEGCLFICGGFSDQGDHIDVWAYSEEQQSWILLSPDSHDDSSPSPRYCGALSYRNGQLYLFGGRSRRHPKLNYNDLWVFDLRKLSWKSLQKNRGPHTYTKEAVFPGYHAKSAAATVGSRWYILGGEGLTGHVSDFWVLDRDSLQWTLLQPARGDDPTLW